MTQPSPTCPLPANEADRLATLRRMRILDTLPQAVFNHITALAADICGAPMALITLIDENRQWVKARQGMDITESPRDQAFCSHTVLDNDRVLVVADATQDSRFAQLEKVRQGEVSFYAGAPIVTPEGHALGAVCVLDRQQRGLSDHQQAMLTHLAGLTLSLMQHEALRREEAVQTLDQVQRNEAVIRHVLDQGREMAAFLDRDHRYRLVNPAFELYWVERRDEIMGMLLPDLVGQALYRQLRPAIHRAMAGEEVQIEIDHVYPGLGQRHMEVRYGPARDDDGQVIGVVERHRDITELRRQARELARAVEALEGKRRLQLKFLQAVSQDLRQPVDAIHQAVPAVATGLPADATPARQGLDAVRRSGRRLSLLLEDLQLVGGQDLRELATEATPLAERIGRALARLGEELGQGPQARPVQIDLPADLRVQMEPALLELALRILLMQVHRQHRDPGVPLRVSARAVEDQVQIDVGTAPGGPALGVATVALMADQVSPADEDDLGLSTVRHLARLHGGVLARAAQTEKAGEPMGAPRLVLQLPLREA